jgi:hypothetical protein
VILVECVLPYLQLLKQNRSLSSADSDDDPLVKQWGRFREQLDRVENELRKLEDETTFYTSRGVAVPDDTTFRIVKKQGLVAQIKQRIKEIEDPL